MSNRRFYCKAPLSLHSSIKLPENVAMHATRVLRLNVNDSFTLFNGDGSDYQCTLTDIRKNEAFAQVNSGAKVNNESPLIITLLQGISSGDRMDITLQKAVELGVSNIVPIKTERSLVKLSAERVEKRAAHWQQVVIAACEQSGRAFLPKVESPATLNHWLASNQTDGNLRLVLDPTASKGLKEIAYTHQNITILIGAEGGLTADELNMATQHSFISIQLGNRILRTETAPLACIAAMQVLWGDF